MLEKELFHPKIIEIRKKQLDIFLVPFGETKKTMKLLRMMSASFTIVRNYGFLKKLSENGVRSSEIK